MSRIRNELGSDALILSTDNRGDTVEVTVALDTEDEPDLPAVRLEVPGVPERGTPTAAAFRRHNLPAALGEELAAAMAGAGAEVACRRLFRFGRLPLDGDDGVPLLVSGPPGAGKTLTVAKLATRLVRDGHRPMVITADDRRAGGVEQLAAFTRLLGLTLIAVAEPEQLRRALRRRNDGEPVLIDTPALDPREPDEEAELSALLGAARPNLALVMPCGLDATDAAEMASAHAALGARLMIPTRLDRNGRLGAVLAASRSAGLLLTEAGTGPGAVDGMTPITPALLATRLELGALEHGHGTTRAALAAATVPAPVRPVEPVEPVEPVHAARGGVLFQHMAAQNGGHRSVPARTCP
ncbi:MAG: GTP-binding protein [Gluconacetobacter diazotrophicus]|nr:GTP-binding protein [Gluconacetobacter diazotrophicus]